MKLIINTDGGSRGNPGPAASAFVARSNAGELLEKCGNYIGIQTNNVAEYTAILAAWDWLLKQNTTTGRFTEIIFRLDSELVVRQVQRIYKVKDTNLAVLWKQILEKQEKFHLGHSEIAISYLHVPREQNSEADSLVNETLDGAGF